MDSHEPSEVLLMEGELNIESKQKLRVFLLNKLDVFAWKHDEMAGIEPNVS